MTQKKKTDPFVLQLELKGLQEWERVETYICQVMPECAQEVDYLLDYKGDSSLKVLHFGQMQSIYHEIQGVLCTEVGWKG